MQPLGAHGERRPRSFIASITGRRDDDLLVSREARERIFGVVCEPSVSTTDEFDHLLLHVKAGRRLDQQVGELSVIGRNQRRPVKAVSVQDPLGQQEGCPLVGFTEGLRASYPR